MSITKRTANYPSLALLSRLQTLAAELQRFTHTSAGQDESPNSRDLASNPTQEHGLYDISTRKTLDSRAAGIRRSAISSATWTVLNILQKNGFETYLVGGCVRDLLLKKTPKDFDVITTASLKQIKKKFNRCIIVGRRFPICQVFHRNSMVEVSSFNTTHRNVADRQTNCLDGCDEKDFVRWKNSLERDFTINGLFYDPFVNMVYDYVDGIRDLMTSKVRTVIPAHLSFEQDCARILRGLRIAARLGLEFEKDTAAAIRSLSPSIVNLGKQRMMMELNYMLAYGAAESSLCLLQKFKLLEVLLPVHAAYLADQTRKGYGESSTMLMKLFSNLDKLLAADRPSDCNLWLALLSFHLALVQHPQDALVVWTLSSILYHGTCTKAVAFARESSKVPVKFVPEILLPSGTKSDESLLEETSHFALLIRGCLDILTSADVLQCLLARHQDRPPCLGLVLVSKNMRRNVEELFNVLATDIKSYAMERKTCKIDYELLKKGDPDETRFVLGKVIMNTMEGQVTCTQEQNPNMAPTKKNLRVQTCEENKNVDLREEINKHSGEKNQKVVPARKSRKHTAEPGQKQRVANKSKDPHRNVAVMEQSHLVELTGEQSENATAPRKTPLDETYEQNQMAPSVKKRRRPLSALFK